MEEGAKNGGRFWGGLFLLLAAAGLLANWLINRVQDVDGWTNATWVLIIDLFIWLYLWRKYSIKPDRLARPHPYADELSTEAEANVDAKRVTYLWLVGSTLVAGLGLWISTNYSPHVLGFDERFQPAAFAQWNNTNVGILGTGLLLLALKAWSPEKWTWTKWLGLPGWVLFGFYWALTARDLFITEDSDYVNSMAAVLAVYAFTYLAYHEWLNIVRGVPNAAVQWMRKTAVVAAGTYFAIAYIAPFRIGLIKAVGGHTNSMMNLFGVGSKLGLEFEINEVDILGPVDFQYTDTHNMCPDGTRPPPPSQIPDGGPAACLDNSGADGWFQDLLFYIPDGETIDPSHGLKIVTVSIILACTAIQTIMLFVGMFLATPDTSWKKRIQFSVAVGAVIYVLNLVRNSIVIWAYGRGHTSFWMIHNFLAKLLTLSALVGIAWVCFRWFPEFFRSLGGVLDLPHRDGPLERTLKLGRRRPEGGLEAASEPAAPSIE